jgi:hypothetical protein
LHVRELERERFAPTLILLDSRLPASGGDPQALELAVSFAAEVARTALREGSTISIVGFFPEPALLIASEQGEFKFESEMGAGNAADPGFSRGRGPESGRGGGLGRVMEALARLTPSDAATADALRPLAVRGGLTSRSSMVSVSPTRATAESLHDAFLGHPMEIHVTSEIEFSDVFRLLRPTRPPDAGRSEEAQAAPDRV